MTGEAQRRYFGTAVTPLPFQAWLDGIAQRRAQGRRRFLSGHHNLHSLYLLRRDSAVADFYHRCDECYIDGMPVRLVLRGAGTATGPSSRFSLMDRFDDLLAHARDKDWVLFYLGSSETVVQRARQLITARYPGLSITLHNGYDLQGDTVQRDINRLQPDLLLVGMGMPLQERWLNDNLHQLDVGTATQAGATLDYFAGAQASPPRWLSDAGMAWSYRLLHDPGRLWRRYLLEPWSLLLPTLQLWLSGRDA